MQRNGMVLAAVTVTAVLAAVALGMLLSKLPEPETTPPIPVRPPSTSKEAPDPAASAPGPSLRNQPTKPPDRPSAVPEEGWKTTASGLKLADVAVGTGAEVHPRTTVTLEHTAWIEGEGAPFDSSYRYAAPLDIQIGVGKVTKGWDEGILGMKVGGKRLLVIPPELGYGAMGRPPLIPPNATITYEIEVLAVGR